MEGTFQVGKWMASMGRSGYCCCIYWGSTCRSIFSYFEWWTSATRGFYTVLVFEKHFWHDFFVTGLFDCKIPTDSWILYSIFFGDWKHNTPLTWKHWREDPSWIHGCPKVNDFFIEKNNCNEKERCQKTRKLVWVVIESWSLLLWNSESS